MGDHWRKIPRKGEGRGWSVNIEPAICNGHSLALPMGMALEGGEGEELETRGGVGWRGMLE